VRGFVGFSVIRPELGSLAFLGEPAADSHELGCVGSLLGVRTDCGPPTAGTLRDDLKENYT
jgi:hypothetical protein